jgi:hypothetical protein
MKPFNEPVFIQIDSRVEGLGGRYIRAVRMTTNSVCGKSLSIRIFDERSLHMRRFQQGR